MHLRVWFSDYDNETIYVGERVTNQYHGVRDLDIAYRLSRILWEWIANLATELVSRSDRRGAGTTGSS